MVFQKLFINPTWSFSPTPQVCHKQLVYLGSGGHGKKYFGDHELFTYVPGYSLKHQAWTCFFFLKTSAVVCFCCQRSSRHASLFRIQWPQLARSDLNDLSLGALGHWLDFCLPALQPLPVLGVALGQGIIFPLAWKHTDPNEQRLVRGRRTAAQEELRQMTGGL